MTREHRRSPHSSLYGAAAVLLAAAVGIGCADSDENPRIRVADGSAELGAKAIRKYGCGSCHTIPGIRGADALVGPPLIHWSQRTFIAGQLTNTPNNLIRWIQDPEAVEPGTAMPNLGVSPAEARNIAAFLLQIE